MPAAMSVPMTHRPSPNVLPAGTVVVVVGGTVVVVVVGGTVVVVAAGETDVVEDAAARREPGDRVMS